MSAQTWPPHVRGGTSTMHNPQEESNGRGSETFPYR